VTERGTEWVSTWWVGATKSIYHLARARAARTLSRAYLPSRACGGGGG
jgi:hypothetical protein